MNDPRTDLRLPHRRQTYTALVAIALGMVLVGLAIPWVAGDSVDERALDAGAGGGRGLEVGETSFETTTTEAPTTSEDAPSSGTAGSPGAVGSATPGRTASPSGTSSVAAAGGGATDVGVTPTSVKIGFLLLDIGNVGSVGVGVPGIDPKQQEEAIRVELDEINEAGGINGRMIEPFFRPFDVLSQDDMRAACLAATEDAKVFAVVAAGGYEPAQGLCVTKEHKTPLIAWCCSTDEWFAESEGRLFTVFAGSRRLMLAWAEGMHERGLLKGKKIGVLNDDRYDPGQHMAKKSLLPALARFGYSVTHLSRLSQDLNTGASQIPNEVQQMRLKGVDTVLLTANTLYVAQFTQQADAQGWHPAYYTSDWAGLNTDATVANTPRSFGGSLSWSVSRTNEWRVGLPEQAPAARCRERYEKATGKKLERESDSNEYGGTIMWCDLTKLLLAGLRNAGPGLTRGAFVGGVENAGPLPLGNIGGGRLEPGRRDAADLIRIQQWDADTKHWLPATDFEPINF